MSSAIEEGYDYIVQFADQLDEQVLSGQLTIEIQLQIREQLMVLQNLLDRYNDIGVANLFREQILPLLKGIPSHN